MPYRIDLEQPAPHALDRLVELGALDVEATDDGLAALMPDAVPADVVATTLGAAAVRVSPGVGRDDDSVWTLNPHPVRVGPFVIVRPGMAAGPEALIIADGPAFGTGSHPTTALCLEAMAALVDAAPAARVLDVGTGTAILALAALRRGAARAVGLDTDPAALRAAAENARLNGLGARLRLVGGGAESVRGTWPIVVANIRAAELMEMAPALVRRVERRGALVLSGIPVAVAGQVSRTYERLGLRRVTVSERDSWAAVTLQPTW